MPLKRTPPHTNAFDSSSSLPHSESEPNLSIEFEQESSSSINVATRKRKLEYVQQDLRELFLESKGEQDKKLAVILSAIEEVKSQNTEIRKSMDFLSEKYDQALKRIDDLEEEKKSTNKYIKHLEDRMEQLDRKSRSSCFEVRNIPKKSDETPDDLISLVQGIAKIVNVPIQPTDFRDLYRVKSRNTEKSPIVAELRSVLVRDNFMKSVRNYNNAHKENKLNYKQLNADGPAVPIFATDCLTFKSRKLYAAARDFAKNYNYTYCWTNYGKIYLRKKENLPLIRIECTEDLNKLPLD
jgi:hypothetical protein